MKTPEYSSLARQTVLIAMVAIGAAAHAQSTADSKAPAPSAASPPAASADQPSAPPPEIVKKAKEAGLKPEVRKNGVTVYCWEDATVGTRFKTKKCVEQSQVAAVAEQRQIAREQIRNISGCGGAGCGGGK